MKSIILILSPLLILMNVYANELYPPLCEIHTNTTKTTQIFIGKSSKGTDRYGASILKIEEVKLIATGQKLKVKKSIMGIRKKYCDSEIIHDKFDSNSFAMLSNDTDLEELIKHGGRVFLAGDTNVSLYVKNNHLLIDMKKIPYPEHIGEINGGSIKLFYPEKLKCRTSQYIDETLNGLSQHAEETLNCFYLLPFSVN